MSTPSKFPYSPYKALPGEKSDLKRKRGGLFTGIPTAKAIVIYKLRETSRNITEFIEKIRAVEPDFPSRDKTIDLWATTANAVETIMDDILRNRRKDYSGMFTHAIKLDAEIEKSYVFLRAIETTLKSVKK